MLFLTVVSGLLGSFSGELRASTPCRITGWHLLCLYALQLMSAHCVTNLHWNNELCTSRCQPWACCACEGWLCSAWAATLVLMAHLRLAAFHWRLSLQTCGSPLSGNLSFHKGCLKEVFHVVFHLKVSSRCSLKVIRSSMKVVGLVGGLFVCSPTSSFVLLSYFAGTLVSTHVWSLWD